MADYDKKLDIENIHSDELNLLDGQVEIILRALELYVYNIEYILNSNNSSDKKTSREKENRLFLRKYKGITLYFTPIPICTKL